MVNLAKALIDGSDVQIVRTGPGKGKSLSEQNFRLTTTQAEA